jgi:lactate 2-monooxygenase
VGVIGICAQDGHGDLAASLVQRTEEAGFKGIVVTLDTWITGWRPRDLSTANFPQLRGPCLANYFSA